MATLQEVSENWDDDFEFQVERRKISTATTATTATSATENWDDDFEDSRQSPQKKIIQRHVEESWDDEDEEDDSAEFGFFAEEDRTVTAKSRRAALARLSTPLPLPPRSPNSSVFSVPTTIHTYSSTTHLRPTSAFALIPPSPPIHKGRRLRKKSRPKPQGVFELADMPSTQQRPSFSDIDVQPDLPRPAPDFAMRRIEVSSRSDLSSVDERPPLVPAAAAAADTSIGSSSGPVSIPPTPTKGAALLSRIGSVKSWGVRRKRGDSTTPADTTAIANESPIEREPVSKWDPRRRKRGDSTTPADTTGIRAEQDAHTQAQSHLTSIVSYLPTPSKGRRRGGSTTPADVISSDRRDEFDPRLTPRASSSLSYHQHQHHPPLPPLPLPPALPPLHPHSDSSHPTPQQRAVSSSNWFFRTASKSSNDTTATNANSELGSTSSSPPNGVVRSRRSGSRSRVRSGRDGDEITNQPGNLTGNPNGAPNANLYSTRTPNGSRTDLSEREESALSGKRRKGGKDVTSASGDDGSATGNPKLPTLTPTTTPTKLVKRKSFGFVHLGRGFGGHGGGENEVVGRNGRREGDEDMESEKGKQEWVGRAQNQKDVLHDRYAGLGLGRAGGGGVDESDGSENPKNETRSRRRSLSRFLMDRDKDKDGVREKDKEKEKENEDYHQPHHPKEKEGSRSFMGSVRRISLVSVGVVGRHKKTKSGGGFIGGAGGGSPARIPPLPCSLPPVLASASQVSLRIHSTTNPGSGQRYTSSDVSAVDLRRAASLSSPNTGSSGDLASSSPTPVRSRPGSNSRPPSISSSTKRRRRTLSKSKSKPRKSEESQELSRDRVPKASLDIQQEREPSDLSEENDIPIPKTPTRATVAAAMAAVSSQQQPPLPAMPLLPPIELQPPSPPRTTTKRHIQRRSRAYTTNEFVEGLELEGLVGMPSTSVFFTPTRGGAGSILPLPPLSPSKLSPGKSPSQSQQSVSLGRSTAVNVVVAGDESAGLSLASGNGSAGAGAGAGGLPRRNSLGDLKIPARISQAQVGLRRDLGMVREFASNVEQLKELQTTYNTLVIEVQALLDTHIQLHQRVQRPVETSPPPVVPQTTSPNFFTQLKPRPKTRGRSNTNPTAGSTIHVPEAAVDSSSLDLAITSSQAAYKSLVEAFWKITSKYRISWECAELLIELGSGSGGGDVVMSAPPSAATTSVSAPVIQPHLAGTGEGKMSSLKGRERAITLAGDEPKHSTTPPPPPAHHETETQVQSQPSSVFVPITGSSSMPGGMQATIATNSGPPLASPPSTSWRASTGRHDLSQRQLVLLREILNNNVATASGDDEGGLGLPPLLASIPLVEDTAPASSPYYPSLRSRLVNRDWRWGDARNSTITLSEEQESEVVDESGRRDRKVEKKRRSGRLGMSGIRDLLRSLKKSHVEEPQIGNANVDEGQSGQHYHHHHHARLSPIVPTMHSTSSLSTESSIDNKSVQHQLQPQPQQQQQQQNRLPIPRIPSQIRRRGRSSTGPESMNKGPSSTSFTPSSFTVPKPSPRRPSLASIFRIGNSNSGKTRPASGIVHTGVGVGVEDPAGSSSSAFAASEHDLSAAQSSSTTTGTRADDSNSTGGEEEEDWDRMDSASDLDAASATAAAKALGAVDGPYDVSATVRGRNKFKSKADDRKRAGVSPYLQHQSSYDSDHHLPPPPVPPSSSSTGLGGFLARHSIIPKRSFSASQSSIWGTGGGDGQPQHSPNVPSGLSRHSNFEEHQQHTNVEPASLRISSSKSAPTTTGQSKLLNTSNLNFVSSSTPGASSSRPSSSRSTKFPHVNAKTGSVRSMPPHLAAASLLPSGFQGQPSPLSSLPDPKQAMIMTPENIKPLLENSKKVHVKLHECIAEIRALIDGAVAVSHIGVQTTATSTVPAS